MKHASRGRRSQSLRNQTLERQLNGDSLHRHGWVKPSISWRTRLSELSERMLLTRGSLSALGIRRAHSFAQLDRLTVRAKQLRIQFCPIPSTTSRLTTVHSHPSVDESLLSLCQPYSITERGNLHRLLVWTMGICLCATIGTERVRPLQLLFCPYHDSPR